MKIGQTPDKNAALAPAVAQKQAKSTPAALAAKEGAAPPAPAAGVPVTVSTFARSLEKSSQVTGEFNADRVKAVRAAIEAGTYKVDAEAIADKMLSNAQELLSRS